MHGKGRIQENGPPQRVGRLCVCFFLKGVGGGAVGFFSGQMILGISTLINLRIVQHFI